MCGLFGRMEIRDWGIQGVCPFNRSFNRQSWGIQGVCPFNRPVLFRLRSVKDEVCVLLISLFWELVRVTLAEH